MEVQPWFVWFILGVIFLVLEIFTPGFMVSIIGIACLFTGIVALIINSLQIQIVFFIISLTLLFVFIRPILLKFISRSGQESNVFSLIGKECIVEEEINNTKNTGYVKISGDHWKARSIDDSIIEINQKVKVEKIEGNTLYVSLIK